jgi:F-type H+-transporting ATPase subunit delta
LIHNKRVAIISDISSSFIQLYNKHNNIKEAVVITASPIDKNLENQILSQIKIPEAKSITLTNLVDSSIIGGFIIRYDGKEYNASIKQNLKNLKTELTN